MADTEVETILREIRERVRAGGIGAHAPQMAEAAPPQPTSVAEARLRIGQALALLETHLAITGRARNQLPPLTSKRSGWLAKVELWIKRRVKQATRWYTWEQVNFNEAVHHALRDLLVALATIEQERERNAPDQRATASCSQAQLESYFASFDSRLTSLEQKVALLASSEVIARLQAEAAEVREEVMILRRALDRQPL